MAFPPGFLDELRSRVSLGDLVGRHVRLTRRGREQGGLCPFHNEKTPSFYVVEDKGFFHCFGCGAHGDAIGFVMRADNLDFIEAVERLAGEAGLAVPQQTPQAREQAQRQKTLIEALAAAAGFYEAQLWSPSGARARDYLTARGLDEETIRRFRLGWAGEDRQALRRALGKEFPEALLHEAGLLRTPEGGGNPYDYFRGRVMFPIADRAGRVIAFGGRTIGDDQPKYLNSPDTPVFEKGRVLYGLSIARANIGGDADPGGHGVIVVEGYMDVIALHRAGFGTAVAPLGTALTEMQLQELWRLSPEPVLCFDGDTAGQRAALRAAYRTLPLLLQPGPSVRFAKLPPGEDPDSLVRRRGRTGFEEVLAAAQPLWKVIFRNELDSGPSDTPERRANLESRLKAAANSIPHQGVQYQFRQQLLREFNRITNAVRPNSRPPGPRSGIGRPRTGHEGPPPPPRSSDRVLQEVRLKILLEHPFLIAEAIEEIAEFEFSDPRLDSLRRAILLIDLSLLGLDGAALQQHLCSAGFARSVNAILSPSVAYAGFLPPDSDRDAVRSEWARINALVASDDGLELEPAQSALTSDISPETWEQTRALKLRKLAAEEFSTDDLDSNRR
jgi:DNA primase